MSQHGDTDTLSFKTALVGLGIAPMSQSAYDDKSCLGGSTGGSVCDFFALLRWFPGTNDG